MAERYKYTRKKRGTARDEVVVKWRGVVVTENLEAAEGLNALHAQGRYNYEWKRGKKAGHTVYRLKKLFGSGRPGKAEAQRWERDRLHDLRAWRATQKSMQRIETRLVGPLVESEVDTYLNSIRGVYHRNTFENKIRFLKTGGKEVDLEEEIPSETGGKVINTYRSYSAVIPFAVRFENKPLNEISRELLEDYLDQQYPEVGDQVMNRKYNAHLKEIKAFFAWATRRHKWGVNPAREIKNRATKMADRKVARYDDVKKMIEKAEGQDRNLLATLWWTGGRRTQTLELKWEDIDLETRQIKFRTAKTKNGAIKEKYVPILPWLEPYLEDQKKNYRHLSKDDSVFINLNESHKRTKFYRRRFLYNSNFVTRMSDNAGVPAMSYHAMRRGVATFLYDHDVDYLDIQAILGHDDVETTKRYIHSLRPARKAREAIVEKLGSVDL